MWEGVKSGFETLEPFWNNAILYIGNIISLREARFFTTFIRKISTRLIYSIS